MKVLFSHHFPFFLAHGGLQTQIEALMHQLRKLGVEVEPERWWDENQTGDVLQYFGRPGTNGLVRAAKRKGFKVAMFENLDQTASRSVAALRAQKIITRSAKKLLPGLMDRLAWDVYQELDALIYATNIEWETARYLFAARQNIGHVIGHGLDEVALEALSQAAPEGDYLISIATITERKNTLLLAEAARRARVPVVFLGKPYSTSDECFLRFKAIVDDRFVRYPGYVTEAEKWRLIRSARGFVLLSQFESGCIAVYEAAAAGLPLLLSALPWATKVYHDVAGARFISPDQDVEVASKLVEFFKFARRGNRHTFPVPAWRDVARSYLSIYEKLVSPN
jgi:glycosyltransferase involved in cell wall biosynthesis